MFPKLFSSLTFCYLIARSHTPQTQNSSKTLLKFVTLVSFFSISVKKRTSYFKAYLDFTFFQILLQEAFFFPEPQPEPEIRQPKNLLSHSYLARFFHKVRKRKLLALPEVLYYLI